MDERIYWVAFNRVSGIGPARVRSLLDKFGGLEAAWYADAWAIGRAGLDRRSIESWLETRRTLDLAAEQARLEALGVQVLIWTDTDYPALLRQIPSAPPVLYVRGALVPADEWAVAVVGTRRMSAYGEAVTRQLVADLVAAGLTIVSGLALGVDALAHQVALECGGRTIAVLGSGVDRLYPARNRGLATRIMQQGAVVSDYPLGTPPDAVNFPPRNRIVSGLARGTLVIEAGDQSGALITANYALDHGREVLAVPGSILSRSSRGPNALIRDGATPVLEAADVIRALDLEMVLPQREVRQMIPATDDETRVLALLSDEPCHVDQLGQATELAAGELSSLLAIMELKGLVRRVGSMSYVAVR
ncbi:MAG: DNA-processing protein DprA [Ardenticatenaceae bacterium]|nr:DNA-processing protein DprA [Ardenticatenaceae bacterium]